MNQPSTQLHTFIQFFPILLIFLYVSYPYEIIQISETVLGKFFAVILITVYYHENPIYGLFTCAIILLYYQMDLSRGVWSVYHSQRMQESMQNMERELSSLTSFDKSSERSGEAPLRGVEAVRDKSSERSGEAPLRGVEAVREGNDPPQHKTKTVPFRDTRWIPSDIIQRSNTTQPQNRDLSSLESFTGINDSYYKYDHPLDYNESVLRKDSSTPAKWAGEASFGKEDTLSQSSMSELFASSNNLFTSLFDLENAEKNCPWNESTPILSSSFQSPILDYLFS